MTDANGPGREVAWFDDFDQGFQMGPVGGTDRWLQFESGSHCPDDAIATVDHDGLRVVPKGVNPLSGEPAFTQTIAPSAVDAEVPGVVDHVKWLATVNDRSAGAFPGFDTTGGKAVRVEAVMSARTYGTGLHPFGDVVADAESDFRLGAAALLTLDRETNIVFSFFLTNTGIFALYERAPFARDALGNYAAFSFAVPVGARTAPEWHALAVSYDRACNTARWWIDGQVVLEVDQVGRRLDRRYMVIDIGGDEQIVRLDQLECGIGMYTLLDASIDGGPGLVDLYGYPMFFCTQRGAPHPAQYVDADSLEGSRLFGQGVELRCRRLSVTYQ